MQGLFQVGMGSISNLRKVGLLDKVDMDLMMPFTKFLKSSFLLWASAAKFCIGLQGPQVGASRRSSGTSA